ncbi:MAG: diacylglycerol/lipid kinase family protein [Sediminispirochaetaceae bacterium]
MHAEHYIIFNPTADHGKAIRHIAQIEATLDRHGIPYKLELTRSSGHAIELARDAAVQSVRGRQSEGPGFSTIVAAGGDGTVNEVINGLMEAKSRLGAGAQKLGRHKSGGHKGIFPAFGVIPVGRGNDFSYGAGVPHSIEQACLLLKDPAAYDMDVGRVSGGYYPEGRYFGNGIGIGFDTLVGLEAAEVTWIPGFLGYVYGALKMLIVYPSAPLVRIGMDEDETGGLETYTPQISLMNGRRMGGTFYMAPEGVNHDGLLDLCMAQGRLKRMQLLKAIGQYTRGSQAQNPVIYTGRTARYRIETLEGDLVCHADGETICTEGKELVVECFPGALQMKGVPLKG